MLVAQHLIGEQLDLGAEQLGCGSLERERRGSRSSEQCAQMDRAPYQNVDLHDLIDSTSVIRGRTLDGGTVVKEYVRTLGQVPGSQPS